MKLPILRYGDGPAPKRENESNVDERVRELAAKCRTMHEANGSASPRSIRRAFIDGGRCGRPEIKLHNALNGKRGTEVVEPLILWNPEVHEYRRSRVRRMPQLTESTRIFGARLPDIVGAILEGDRWKSSEWLGRVFAA